MYFRNNSLGSQYIYRTLCCVAFHVFTHKSPTFVTYCGLKFLIVQFILIGQNHIIVNISQV